MGDRLIKLVCTDRGQHKETFLGYLDFRPAGDKPVGLSDLDPEPRDEIFFRGSRESGPSYPHDQHAVASILEDGFVVPGEDHLDVERKRFQLATCARCPRNIPMREERLLIVVREAWAAGMSRLDGSYLV